MQFNIQSSLLAAILAASVFGAAVPEVIAPTSTSVADAQPTGEGQRFAASAVNLITVCKNTKFGSCRSFAGDTNRCCQYADYIIYSDDLPSDWNDKASSVRAFPGFYCYIYMDFGCGGYRGGPVQDDNAHDDLGKHGWNDKTSSYLCLSR
ncbi:hypothetical protein B0J11DRAFT_507703 [Dendryphion nanum]|uniref:Uncharacterized protein n=1 Tax=Dendryphion nanum TaxID=256645 RepID=A0A9P9DPN8_9PLEO|nr:hypothetical protein B0J11DRAFT_507703 [Dendryphion nanum]